jgi:hypothetical protein
MGISRTQNARRCVQAALSEVVISPARSRWRPRILGRCKTLKGRSPGDALVIHPGLAEVCAGRHHSERHTDRRGLHAMMPLVLVLAGFVGIVSAVLQGLDALSVLELRSYPFVRSESQTAKWALATWMALIGIGAISLGLALR